MQQEIRRLNTLRGIAALTVVISHYSNATLIIDGLLGYGAGQLGVMLFFVLSGFLMAHLYAFEPLNAVSARKFVLSRFARVVPLFVVVVVLSYILHKSGERGIFYLMPNLKMVTAHLLFLRGVDILWTIPPEIHFYILFVGLWWLGQRSIPLLLCLMAAVFSLLWWAGFPDYRFRLFGLPVHITLLQALPYFFLGMLLGLAYRHWRAPPACRSHWFTLTLLFIPLLFPKVLALFTDWQYQFWRDAVTLLVVGLVFFTVLFLVPEGNRMLENRLGDFLGRVSYSLYLLHLPVLKLMEDYLQEAPWVMLPVFLLSALTVSQLSYLLLENPCRRSIRRAAGA